MPLEGHSKTVAIFKPKVKDEPDARPKKTWTVVEVVKEREAKGLTVDYDQTGNAVFGGRGPAGSKVLLYVDNNAYGLAFINDKGTWTFAGNAPLTIGTHTLRADEIGGDGVVKSRIEMPFNREAPKPAGCRQLRSKTRKRLKNLQTRSAKASLNVTLRSPIVRRLKRFQSQNIKVQNELTQLQISVALKAGE